MKDTYHIIIKDDSGHNYIIPEDEEHEFETWVIDCENCKISQYDYSGYMVDLPKVRIIDWIEI